MGVNHSRIMKKKKNNMKMESSKKEKYWIAKRRTDSVILLDSRSGHCPRIVEKAAPAHEIINKFIPTGATWQMQLLDVFGFSVFKNCIHHFSDDIVLTNHNINLHRRNNIIKLQSSVYNQLTSLRKCSNFFK